MGFGKRNNENNRSKIYTTKTADLVVFSHRPSKFFIWSYNGICRVWCTSLHVCWYSLHLKELRCPPLYWAHTTCLRKTEPWLEIRRRKKAYERRHTLSSSLFPAGNVPLWSFSQMRQRSTEFLHISLIEYLKYTLSPNLDLSLFKPINVKI